MIFFRGNVGPKVSDLTWTIQMFWSYACCFIWLHLVLPLSSEQTQLLSGTTLGNWNPSRLPSLVKQNLKTTGTSIYHLNGQSMFFHAPPPNDQKLRTNVSSTTKALHSALCSQSFKLQCIHHQESTLKIFYSELWSHPSFHAYITKKATVSADQTTAKDFTKNGIITLIRGIRRNK